VRRLACATAADLARRESLRRIEFLEGPTQLRVSRRAQILCFKIYVLRDRCVLACLAPRSRGCVPAALLRCGFADAAALLVLPACVERHLKLLALPALLTC
jgi:hypothetical protein